jgi:hypothetical protein
VIFASDFRFFVCFFTWTQKKAQSAFEVFGLTAAYGGKPPFNNFSSVLEMMICHPHVDFFHSKTNKNY